MRTWTLGRRRTFGDVDSADIVFDDQYMSPKHIMVGQEDDGRAWIMDLLSTNGTRVRRGEIGVKLEAGHRHELRPGDVVLIGRTEIPWTLHPGR